MACKEAPVSRQPKSGDHFELMVGHPFLITNNSAPKHDHYKSASMAIAKVLLDSDNEDNQRDGYDMYKCQSRIHVDHDHIIGARCRHRLCPLCQWRKQTDLRRDLIEIITTSKLIRPYRSYSLTLTVENVPFAGTREAVKAMHQAFGRLMNYKEIKAGVSGYARMTEVAEENGREGYVNPHMHVVICVNSAFHRDNYISAKRWTALWRKATKNPRLTAIRRQGWHVLTSDVDESYDLRPFEIANTVVYGMKPLARLYTDRATGEERVLRLPSAQFIIAMNQQLRGITMSSWGGVFKVERNRHREETKERKKQIKAQRLKSGLSESKTVMGDPTQYSNERMLTFIYLPYLGKYIEEGFEHLATCFHSDYLSKIEHQTIEPVEYKSSYICDESVPTAPRICPPINDRCEHTRLPGSDGKCINPPDDDKHIIPSTDEGVKTIPSQPKTDLTPCSNSANDHCVEGTTFLNSQGTCKGEPGRSKRRRSKRKRSKIDNDKSSVTSRAPQPFDVLKAQEEISQRRLEAMRRSRGLWAKDGGHEGPT